MHIGAFLALRGAPTPTVPASLSLRSAAFRLAKSDGGAAIVKRRDGTLSGIVCQSSVIGAIARYGEAAFDQAVGDVGLHQNLICCSVDHGLRNVLERLSEEDRSFAGVTNRFRLVDLVFRDELAAWLLSSSSIAQQR